MKNKNPAAAVLIMPTKMGMSKEKKSCNDDLDIKPVKKKGGKRGC